MLLLLYCANVILMRKTKIALIGFGKMGQEVDALCKDSKIFEVVSISYKNKLTV